MPVLTSNWIRITITCLHHCFYLGHWYLILIFSRELSWSTMKNLLISALGLKVLRFKVLLCDCPHFYLFPDQRQEYSFWSVQCLPRQTVMNSRSRNSASHSWPTSWIDNQLRTKWFARNFAKATWNVNSSRSWRASIPWKLGSQISSATCGRGVTQRSLNPFIIHIWPRHCHRPTATSETLVSREFFFHFHFSFSMSSRFNFTFTSRKRVMGFYFSLFTSQKKWKLSVFHSFSSRKKSEIRCRV